MDRQDWKAYFTFTHRERQGVLVLLLLLMIIFFAPHFFQENKTFYTTEGKDTLQRIIEEHIQSAPAPEFKVYKTPRAVESQKTFLPPAKLFPFDPNTLSLHGWKELGVSDKNISTIMHFLEKGGKFRQAMDIRKIYGFKTETCDRLMPFIFIEKPTFAREKGKSLPDVLYQRIPGARKAPRLIDINEADSIAWESLPAIGSKLAARIVLFRQKLGGFYSIHQVSETYGITDSAFQVILPYLACEHPQVRKININTADLEVLRQHPYLKWNIAHTILQYRVQHGNFKETKEIMQAAVISAEMYGKIAPYLVVE